jgi:hypothetical protein
MPREPEPEPLESSFRELNEAFYQERPWDYFLQRLVHLAAIASDTAKLPFENPISVGPVTIRSHTPTLARYPSPGQSFVAVESEVLLHHAAETLLRLIHAHAEPSPCPWIRMSSIRNFSQFKEWVESLRDDPKLDDLAGQFFGRSDEHPDTPADEAEWVRVFAQHFLDSSSYNAAKHGMALAGGAARGTITIDDKEIVRAQGPVVSWLAKWPNPGVDRPPRWTRVTRILSTEAYIVMIKVAADLMESIWIHGRSLHVGESGGDVSYVAYGSPRNLFKAMDVPGHVLYQTYTPLAYEGEPTDLIAQFPAPSERTGVGRTDTSSSAESGPAA